MSKLNLSAANPTLFALSLTFLVSLTLFSLLAGIVVGNVTLDIDSAFLLWVNTHANPSFDSFFVLVTELGGVIVVTSITLALFVYFIVTKKYHKAVFVALGIGGAALAGRILKSIFERARPDLWDWLIIESNFSFPSGHAIGCSALALCVVMLMWRTKWRHLIVGCAILYVLIVSFSRLYLGVHYPTDILGGWLLSTAWLTLIASLVYLYRIDNARKKML